jgi:hypothetical protein
LQGQAQRAARGEGYIKFDDLAGRRLIDGLFKVNTARECSQEKGGYLTFDDLAVWRLIDGFFKVNSARECSQERGGYMIFDDLAGRRLMDCLGKFCEGVQPGEGRIYDI